MSIVRRFDTSRVGKTSRTTQGFLQIPANVTRTGVLEYHRADGSIRRELRHPEDVFNVDSLATLAGAPVTDLHPAEMVTPENVRDLKHGQVSGDARKDGIFVATVLTVESAEEIARVDSRDRVEISCGYTCKLDPTPGVWEGQRYDARQTEIRYNHVALGPSGWGRAGAQVALRMDSADAVQFDVAHSDALSQEQLATSVIEETHSMEIEIRVDGVAVKVPEAVAKHVQGQTAKIGDLESKLGAADTKVADLQKKLDAATDPKAVAKLVSDRVALESAARKVLGDTEKFDGLSAREIQVKAISKAAPDRKMDGRSDEYVQGAFESLTAEAAEAVDPSVAAARKDAAEIVEPAVEQRLDAAAERKAAQARKANAWKTPAK